MDQTSWLSDGVKEIERITKQSMIVEPKFVKVDQEKPGTYAIVTPGPADKPNRIEIKVAGPHWHNERLETPDQMVRFIESAHKVRKIDPQAGAIYIGRESVRYIYDFEDRRHRATLPLILSEPWKWLLKPQGEIDQRVVIRALRITFNGCLPAQSPLIDVLRKVKWNQNGAVEANLQKGKEALGRTLMNEAAGVENFPDEFVLTVPVYETVRFTVPIGVALELVPASQKFEIIPFPNQMQNGLEATLMSLQDLFEKTKVPTFIGAVTHES